MTTVLALFLAHPHWLIVAGTVVSLLGLFGLSLFEQREAANTELDDGPKFLRQGTAMTIGRTSGEESDLDPTKEA